MQTITNYYYDNTINVQFDISANCLVPDIPQRNRVVYTRPIQIYQGVTNILKVEIKNADQKPVNVTGHTLTFNIVDDYVYSNATTVLTATVEPLDFSVGTGYVAIPALDLVDLNREQYNYNIKIETCWGNVASYVDDNYGAAGQLYINSSAYPTTLPGNLDLGATGDGIDSTIEDLGTI
jgi:hypothetical protein